MVGSQKALKSWLQLDFFFTFCVPGQLRPQDSLSNCDRHKSIQQLFTPLLSADWTPPWLPTLSWGRSCISGISGKPIPPLSLLAKYELRALLVKILHPSPCVGCTSQCSAKTVTPNPLHFHLCNASNIVQPIRLDTDRPWSKSLILLYLELVLEEASGSPLGGCNVKQLLALLCSEGLCLQRIPPGQRETGEKKKWECLVYYFVAHLNRLVIFTCWLKYDNPFPFNYDSTSWFKICLRYEEREAGKRYEGICV